MTLLITSFSKETLADALRKDTELLYFLVLFEFWWQHNFRNLASKLKSTDIPVGAFKKKTLLHDGGSDNLFKMHPGVLNHVRWLLVPPGLLI